jgi:hypothetical protein
MKSRQKIITITGALLVSVSDFSLVTPRISKKPDMTKRELPDDSTVNNAGIETNWDQKCTQKVSSIGWGPLEPGTNKTITLFTRNKEKLQSR